MSVFLGQARRCATCRGHFPSVEAYSEHLPDCVIEHRFRQRKFRTLESTDPLLRQARFADSAFDDSPEAAQVAPFTQAERIDGGLRSGKIKRVPWEEPTDTGGGFLRRIWRAIRGDG